MKYLSLSSLALAVLASSPTMAQQQPDKVPDSDLRSIETLVITSSRNTGYLAQDAKVASKLNLSIQQTPQSISVFSREQMNDFALDNVNDVLGNVTGVNVEQVETDRTYFKARGFDITNFQIDGLGLPLINGNAHGDMDTAIYERIEVVRGANGLMAGSGNPSATINLVRKRPTEDFQANVTGSYGSWSNARLEGDVSGRIGDNTRGRLVIARQDKESYLDRYELEKDVIYGVLDFQLGDDSLLTLGHSSHTSDAKGNLWGALTLYYGDGSPTNFDASTSTSASWSNWQVEEQRSFADLTHSFSSNWSLRVSYSRNRTDEDSLLFYTYLGDAATGLDPQTGLGLVGYGSEYDLDDEQDLLDIYTSGEFTAFGRHHEVVFGASWAELSYQDKSLYDFHTGNGFPLLPAMQNWDGNTPLPEFTDGLTGSDVTDTQKAWYLAARFNLNENINLITGLRHNDWQTKGESYGLDETRDDSQSIPYLGLIYDINEQLTAYASYTETFVAQREKDRNFERLGPLTGEAREIGIKSQLFNGNALLTLAWFDIEQVNLAVFDTTIENPNTGVPEDVYKGAEGISSQGFEVELAGEVLPGLQASIGLTSFDIDGDDQVEAYTPEKSLRLATTYRLPMLEKLRVGASVQWQDDIYRSQGIVSGLYVNAGEEIITRQDAYALVNLMASYEINQNLSLNLNINNLTDETYLNSLYWAQGYYGAPRNVMASVSWSL
ncbi:TonB-dependent siderophore receptor [Lacimicrobium alkaliphilum]|uniref:TonB-dependent receptor n=1 Tax=Lacimicrobium alkaliphilum TaxID=1526571 RepID=A0A0U2ZE81_9ALTE|nr:TonB-dependent siderophore receptor [Lacimicrobium alkaliphilum]ALS97431.1 hypothetical protein AT746_03510 [Lacimicrobium alkaliphilum]